MILNLNKKEMSFLQQHLVGRKDLLESLHMKSENTKEISIECNDGMANEIREIMEELLQEIGFDENYEPNQDGEIIEKLIDKFFVE